MDLDRKSRVLALELGEGGREGPSWLSKETACLRSGCIGGGPGTEVVGDGGGRSDEGLGGEWKGDWDLICGKKGLAGLGRATKGPILAVATCSQEVVERGGEALRRGGSAGRSDTRELEPEVDEELESAVFLKGMSLVGLLLLVRLILELVLSTSSTLSCVSFSSAFFKL